MFSPAARFCEASFTVRSRTLRIRGRKAALPEITAGTSAVARIDVFQFLPGDIREPVLYVKHDVCDYEGRLVTEGMPNPFIESLTHESIIVQIPLLRGQVNTRLDRVLSIFDQSHQDKGDAKLLRIDEGLYDANDTELQRILLRLTGAAADEKFRRRMDLEDEIFAEIKNRNMEIMERDRQLAKQRELLDKRQTQLDEQKSRIDEQKSQIDEQKSQIDEQKSQIDEQKSQIDEQKSQIDEQKSQLAQKDSLIRSSVQLHPR